MKRLLCAAAVVALLLNVQVARAWNPAGHYIIASIAYDELKKPAKDKVDALLRLHPDFPKWILGVPASQQGKRAFIKAAGWPDDIRDDGRFFTEGNPPTKDIPGLPKGSSNRHENWHFTNLPFSNDGTPTKPPPVVNVRTKLEEFQKVGTMDKTTQVYVLPWILHLIGDVHQPLHAIAMFRKDVKNGDRGGTLTFLKGGQKLHSFWDGRIGTSDAAVVISDTAAKILKDHPAKPPLEMKVSSWVQESFDKRNQVYNFKTGTGAEANPATVSDTYSTDSKMLAFERAGLAAHRLAQYLNDNLK